MVVQRNASRSHDHALPEKRTVVRSTDYDTIPVVLEDTADTAGCFVCLHCSETFDRKKYAINHRVETKESDNYNTPHTGCWLKRPRYDQMWTDAVVAAARIAYRYCEVISVDATTITDELGACSECGTTDWVIADDGELDNDPALAGVAICNNCKHRAQFDDNRI